MDTLETVDYDHPRSIDFNLLRVSFSLLTLFQDAVDKLIKGESVKVPVYDKVIEKRTNDMVEIIPGDVILLSGMLSFYDE